MKKLKNIPDWLKEMPKKVKEREQWFQSLPREKARVAILFDAYELARLKRINLNIGNYFFIHDGMGTFPDWLDGKDARSFLNNPAKKYTDCRVCQLGAMMCAWTHINNEFTVDRLSIMSHSGIAHQLVNYFTYKELQLFEGIFEIYYGALGGYPDVDVDYLGNFMGSERFEILTKHLIETGCRPDNLIPPQFKKG